MKLDLKADNAVLSGATPNLDIQVEGIWLSIDQREQFAAFLSKNNGNIPRLTAHLQAQAQQIMAAGPR